MGKSVLIIDDNADACLALKMLLEMDGHAVEVAIDGRSGVAAASRLSPDAVLCDLMLPDMSGFDVVRAIAGVALKVAVSGRDREDVWAECQQAGFHHMLEKPVDLEVLSSLLRD